MAGLQQVVAKWFLDGIKWNVRAFDALELVDEINIVNDHDKIGVSHDPAFRIEQIGFKVDVHRPFAFGAYRVGHGLAVQSIAAAFTCPVAPHVLCVFRVSFYEFLYNVIAVEVANGPKQFKLGWDASATGFPPLHVPQDKLTRTEEVCRSRLDNRRDVQTRHSVIVYVAAFMPTIAAIQRGRNESIREKRHR